MSITRSNLLKSLFAVKIVLSSWYISPKSKAIKIMNAKTGKLTGTEQLVTATWRFFFNYGCFLLILRFS
jgi:hypothetical protein